MKCNVVEQIQGLQLGWLTPGWDAKNTAFILAELMIIMRPTLPTLLPRVLSLCASTSDSLLFSLGPLFSLQWTAPTLSAAGTACACAGSVCALAAGQE